MARKRQHEFAANEPVAMPERGVAAAPVPQAVWEAMLDQMADAAFFFDMAGRLVKSNHAALAIVPWLSPGMTWQDYVALRGLYRPGETHPIPWSEIPLARALRGEHVQDEEFRAIYRDQPAKDLIISASPIWVSGRQVGVLIITHDITECRQAQADLEEQEQLLVHAERLANMGSFCMDLRTKRVRWSDGLYRILGYKPGSVRPGEESFRPRVRPEDLERLERDYQALVTGELALARELQIVRPSGEVRVVRVNGALERDAHGEPIKAVGVMHDITQQLAVERMKSEFIATVSHELRTPLTAVRAPLTMLKGGWRDLNADDVDELLEIAVDGVDRMVRLVNDVLDIQRLSTGRLSIATAPTDAHALVAEAARALAPRAEAAGVALSLHAPALPLKTDGARVVQVLSNLLDNALSFAPAGSTVDVRARHQGDAVRFDVSDRGPGIPPDQLEAVFERFKQLDEGTKRRKGGTGLGLTICREIVGLLGGMIWAERRRGGGTTFSFRLPA